MPTYAKKRFGNVCDGEVEILSLTKDDLEAALNVLRKSFFLKESCCIATEINRQENVEAQEDLIELCREVSAVGASLIAKSVRSGEVIAVVFNIIHVANNSNEEPYFVNFVKRKCRTPNSTALVNLMMQIDSEYDFFKSFNIDCLLEIMFLATSPQFEGRKIATALCRYSIQLARDLNQGCELHIIREDLRTVKIKAVTSLMSAWGSQKIGSNIGMETVMEVPFDRFSFQGKSFSERLGTMSPPTIKVMALKF